MRVTVHDVGHGSCISLIHDNGNVMLWDCGHSDENRPSQFLPVMGINTIHNFFITNYDEDHISDLPNLLASVDLPTLFRNKSISADELHRLKLQGGPISPAMSSMLAMIVDYNQPVLGVPPAFPGVTFTTYSNSYGLAYNETNNISLVTFLNLNGTKFIFPGDVERAGWLGLLAQPGFIEELRTVSVFVASHHGRESGYCSEVFQVCTPVVVVMSDSKIKHATQGMTNIYASHASGMSFGGTIRRVVTTRNDGDISWQR